MRRSLVISAAAVALALALPAVAGAAPRQIDVGDDFFAPKNPPARNFSDRPQLPLDERRRDGQSPTTSARTTGCSPPARLTDGPIDFSIRASAGSYHYYCTLHGTPARHRHARAGQGPPDRACPARGAARSGSGGRTPAPTRARASTSATRWTAGSGRPGRTTRPPSAPSSAATTSPVNYRPNRHNYKLKVRSERKNVSKRSDWSPSCRIARRRSDRRSAAWV